MEKQSLEQPANLEMAPSQIETMVLLPRQGNLALALSLTKPLPNQAHLFLPSIPQANQVLRIPNLLPQAWGDRVHPPQVREVVIKEPAATDLLPPPHPVLQGQVLEDSNLQKNLGILLFENIKE